MDKVGFWITTSAKYYTCQILHTTSAKEYVDTVIHNNNLKMDGIFQDEYLLGYVCKSERICFHYL